VLQANDPLAEHSAITGIGPRLAREQRELAPRTGSSRATMRCTPVPSGARVYNNLVAFANQAIALWPDYTLPTNSTTWHVTTTRRGQRYRSLARCHTRFRQNIEIRAVRGDWAGRTA
jgi:hypothetical protein